jgi:hypothetical protein
MIIKRESKKEKLNLLSEESKSDGRIVPRRM